MLAEYIKGQSYEVVPTAYRREGENHGILVCQVKHGPHVGEVFERHTLNLQHFIDAYPAMKEDAPESGSATVAATDTDETPDSGDTPAPKKSRKRKKS